MCNLTRAMTIDEDFKKNSPHATKISFDDLISYGGKAQRRGEKDDVELIELMKKANALQIQSGIVQR